MAQILKLFRLVSRWECSPAREGERAPTFKRAHDRQASSREMAIALERDHNRMRLRTMTEAFGEGWRVRVVRCEELPQLDARATVHAWRKVAPIFGGTHGRTFAAKLAHSRGLDITTH